MEKSKNLKNQFVPRDGILYDLLEPTLFDNRIWLDTEEAADYLRITVNALRIRIWRKQVAAHKFGNRLRFKKTDLDRYMRLYQ